MNEFQKEILKMIFNGPSSSDQSPHGLKEKKEGIIYGLIGKPVLVETATRYFSGVLTECDGAFLKLTEAQWVSDTGRYSEYQTNPEGDSSAEFEPCNDQHISLGSICTISVLPKVVRKLK